MKLTLAPLLVTSTLVAAFGGRPEAPSFTPSPHAALPQIRSDGGAVMDAAKIVPIVYSGDALAGTLGALAASLGSSAYWAATTSEYGVGPATADKTLVLKTAPPATISSTGVADWLHDQIEHNEAFPAPDDETIYVIYYPATTTVTMTAAGGGSLVACTDFGGYHAPIKVGGVATAQLVVIPRCTGYLGLGTTDFATAETTHQIVDSVTDPGIGYFGFDDPDFAGSGWVEGGAIDLGDMCQRQPDPSYVDAGLGVMVQRSWSNLAAAGGHAPCVPAEAGPYFVAAPELGYGVEVSNAATSPSGTSSFPQGLLLTPGQTVTLDLKLFSDAPEAAWTLSAVEPTWADPDQLLRFTFGKSDGKNGDLRHLQVELLPPPPGHVWPGYTTFEILSTQGAVSNAWWVTVGD